MKKLLLALSLAGLLALALSGATSAQPRTLESLAPTLAGSPSIFTPTWTALADQVIPTVSAISPVSAANDIDTPVTISGANFTAVMNGTTVVTSPTAPLGGTTLTHVTWVNSTTLTAKVPWGMDPGVYPLTVVNPDGGTATLASAFTVTQGIGQWNGGNLFGGDVRQILMKPGDPNTLYVSARGIVGLFRSQDAGEHWTYVSADVNINNGEFAIDPLHPDWIYGYADVNGLQRSEDEGDTWTTVMPNHWPDRRVIGFEGTGQVYVSPHDPQVLFLSSSYKPGVAYPPSHALGLIKSTDGGASWQIVAGMEGLSVQDVAFDPTDLSQKMVLATSDARVFQSSDSGDTWSEVKKPSVSSLGNNGSITYNPSRPTEVWIASTATPGGIYKSTDADWKDVSPATGVGSGVVKFTSADSVYITGHHSEDGGANWQRFGPLTSSGTISFDPVNSRIGYLGDGTYGVQKTTDGGQTWEVKNEGLTGMVCGSMDVSRADPLRVFAACGGAGIYRSDDGANNWTYLPIADSGNVRQVREDPFDSQRLYVTADSGFYVSTDGGESWSDLGWNTSPALPAMHMPDAMEPDPNQRGHLLVGLTTSSYAISTGRLYSSSDYGASWQQVAMPQDLAGVSSIAFDPETPGLVYLTTNGTGVYRSTDGGTTWNRIDDLQQPEMENASHGLTIATHPQPMLLVETQYEYPYRSLDGGATWKKALQKLSWPVSNMFVDGDSTRLYAATGTGLFLSSNAGDSWEPATGALGRLQIMALGYADADGHTILYAATNGGAVGTTSSTASATPFKALATASGLVDAGIYRYAVLPTVSFSSSAYSASEGDGAVTITITRTGSTAAGDSVHFATANGTASAGSDYTAVSKTVSFAAGETSKTVSIPIANDSSVESSETVQLSLSSPSSRTTLGTPNSATLTIVDNDRAFAFSAASYSVGEAGRSATITIKRTGLTTGKDSVLFKTANGTAKAGSDYSVVSKAVSFAAGETQKTVSVPITNDSSIEKSETVQLSLSRPSTGATLGTPHSATLTIQDNDRAFAFSSAAYAAKEGAPTAAVTIKRMGLTKGNDSVLFKTANGTATAGSDYSAVSQSVSFAAGETQKTVSVPITDDSSVEASETVLLSLSNPSSGATLGSPHAATLTISDNDVAPPPPAGKIISAKLTKKSFPSSQAGKVKLACRFSPKSKIFRYVLSLKKGKKWAVVKRVSKTGSFKTYKKTVKKLFAGKKIKPGSYRLKLSADKNSKLLGFRVR